MFWYSFKKEARDYLAQVNKEKKVRFDVSPAHAGAPS